MNRDPELEREVVRVALEELGDMRSRARDERRVREAPRTLTWIRPCSTSAVRFRRISVL